MTDRANDDVETTKDTPPPKKSEDCSDFSDNVFRWNFNGSTRLGKFRSENQDTFTIWQECETSGFLAVFDGAGGIVGGHQAALSASDICLATMKETSGEGLSAGERLKLAIERARKSAKLKELTGLTTAVLVHVKDNILTYATLGDGALAAIWPDGMVSQILVPHHILGQPDNIITGYIGGNCDVPPRTGLVTLEPSTTLMLMSDGASDLFPYQDFAEKREAFANHLINGTQHGLVDNFLTQIEEARDPKTDAYLHDDNMTLVLAHLTERSAGTLGLSDNAEDMSNA